MSTGISKTQADGSSVTGHEADYWRMADALRGSMDAAEYKHVVLGLIFLKYISDAFEEAYAKLGVERNQGADPENRLLAAGVEQWELYIRTRIDTTHEYDEEEAARAIGVGRMAGSDACGPH